MINIMNTSTPLNQAYEEIVQFLAGGITPQSLIEFQASEAVKDRVADLIFREKMRLLHLMKNLS